MMPEKIIVLPSDPRQMAASDTDKFPYINPDILQKNRLTTRPARKDGKPHTFFEKQQESGLFPIEEDLCAQIDKECTYLSKESQRNAVLARQFCLYGHQTQWRDSGEPYSVHPLRMVLHAVQTTSLEEKPDWQTIAAYYDHDLVEDSHKYGHPVMPFKIAEKYKILGWERDGKIVQDILRVLNKGEVFVDEKEKKKRRPDVVRRFLRIKKKEVQEKLAEQVAGTLFDVGRERPDRMRAMLGKLEDRLQNMESIDSLPHEKQERIAKETRDVFVPMAYALRLFKLCDALTTHVVKVLDPDTYLRIIALQTASEKKLDKIRKGNTGKNILNAQLDALPYIKVLREDYRPHVELSVPGFYELMQILREEGELPQQKINMKVILPEFSDTRTDDFVFESLYCFESVKRLFEFKVKHDIGMDRVADVLRTGKKRLHATTEVDGIEIGMEFVAKLQDEKDTSSIAHRFTPHWQRSDRARYAMQHVLYLREKYMDAKRSGTVYTFWGPLAEELRNSL